MKGLGRGLCHLRRTIGGEVEAVPDGELRAILRGFCQRQGPLMVPKSLGVAGRVGLSEGDWVRQAEAELAELRQLVLVAQTAGTVDDFLRPGASLPAWLKCSAVTGARGRAQVRRGRC